jgi:hypothetical protein
MLSPKFTYLIYKHKLDQCLHMAQRLAQWDNKVRIFLDPLTGKFYGKYLAWYLKMMMNMTS